MSDQPEVTALQEAAARLVEAARAAGADAADAVAVKGASQSVEVRLGSLEDSTRSEAEDFGLRVFVGNRVATVSANTLAGLSGLAERAVAMAKVAPPDPWAGLADPNRLTAERPDFDLFDGSAPDAERLLQEATATEDAARAVEGVTNSGGASAYWSHTAVALVTSGGFSGGYRVSRHGRSVSAIAGSGIGMQRDYDASGRNHLADLDPLEKIGRTAGERVVRRLNPRQVKTCTATVVFDPRVATGLLGALAGAINGAAIARGTSFLKSKLGQKVFASGIRVTDDPHRRRGPASRPFDGEGVGADPIDIISDGVLTTWLLDSASARELGLETNGRAARGGGSPGPSSTNLLLHPGEMTQEELLKSVGTGFYVTEFIGHGVNGITGDYSRGAAGYWIENGELTYPVSEVTVAGNLVDMFARMVPANDIEYRSAYVAPTVAIEGLTVAGS
ncbi:peptidase PmbA [Hartmannibacter diazotrophicus]|uniref:Peptidase PmbA n=1 Tax=Hartmannibacter diazotrophicus TaxID=1482074 RepID=A0A2C9D2V9_9HYPH|nr:TldD/PmbA family protein [Hartmannibacter diazotrophicus]SON54642.1 peptidase PmbA [Hartmannibacter diazotrophicus]